MKLVKPPRLVPGAKIGLISTSSPMAALVPHRTERAVEALTSWGYEVVIGKNALTNTGYTAGSGRERAEDLHRFLKDESIGAIISFIGGNHSIHMLEHIDFDLVRNFPKIILGYSDTTVLQLALLTRSNLVTFSGPAALTQLAEYPSVLPYTEEYFNRALTQQDPVGEITPASQYTDEVLNWFTKADLERARKMKKAAPWKWLRPGTARGRLVGGCISSLMHLKGTPYFPDLKGRIFFWEIPEGADFSLGEDVANIDAFLYSLKSMGVLSSLSGMVIGRPYAYDKEQVNALERIMLDVTKGCNYPVLINADFGHTDPMITIPQGVQSELSSDKNRFSIIERGTSL